MSFMRCFSAKICWGNGCWRLIGLYHLQEMVMGSTVWVVSALRRSKLMLLLSVTQIFYRTLEVKIGPDLQNMAKRNLCWYLRRVSNFRKAFNTNIQSKISCRCNHNVLETPEHLILKKIFPKIFKPHAVNCLKSLKSKLIIRLSVVGKL